LLNNPLNIPIPTNVNEVEDALSNRYRYNHYTEFHAQEFTDFINKLTDTTNLTFKPGQSIYCYATKVSQNKLREAEFKITRDPLKADIILIDDPSHKKQYGYNEKYTFYDTKAEEEVIPFMEFIDNVAKKNLTGRFVFVKDIYKTLYKYEGNQTLFNTLNELLESRNNDNVILAMETMTNANWEDNQVYLEELFSRFFNTIKDSNYYNTISFKGFRDSLDFAYKQQYRLRDSEDYRDICKTREHHEFVYNLYKDKLQEALNKLSEKFKIAITDLKIEIDEATEYDETKGFKI
jgi:hypothetical protein